MKDFKVAIMLVLAILFHSKLIAQNATEDKLLGCWKVKSVEFPKTSPESDEMANSAKGMITCFEKKGKFTTKFRENNKEIIIGTGTFKIDTDGKTIIQKRDAEDGDVDAPGEIIKINEKEFSIKVEDVILHFERLTEK
jgi:hypothetical protein